MKIAKHISLFFVLCLALCSCEDEFLTVKDVQTGVSVDDLYSRYSQIQGVIWEAYSYLPDGLGSMWREAATDIAEGSNESSSSQIFNNGVWDQYSNPDDVWQSNFRGIDQANHFLVNMDKVSLDELRTASSEGDSSAYYRAQNNIMLMEGEAYFLKAFFYFELAKRYGGVPLFDKPLDYYNESTWKNVQRSTLDETIKYIVSLCDKAAAIIPATVTTDYSWYEDGRVTNGAIKALKARVLLYAASPLFKSNGTTATWAQAAAAAHDVIALGQYSLVSSYSSLFGSSNGTSKEIIFKRRYGSINWLEYDQFPINYVGSNGKSFGPTQNFVDQYEVVGKDGSTVTSENFDWNNPAHAADPYANRDSRMAATVLYNGAKFKSAVVETYAGGSSGLPKQGATKTGYYMLKWVISSVDLVNGTSANHTWSYIRYADILLGYAEAMLNAYGADADPEGYGMTAIEAFNMVRKRAKVSELAASQLNQSRIEHERLVEFAFEDQRFWDVRRWNKGTEYFSKPITRMNITKNAADESFKYEVKELENRVFSEKMNWYPIPQSEIIKTGWSQNPNW